MGTFSAPEVSQKNVISHGSEFSWSLFEFIYICSFLSDIL